MCCDEVKKRKSIEHEHSLSNKPKRVKCVRVPAKTVGSLLGCRSSTMSMKERITEATSNEEFDSTIATMEERGQIVTADTVADLIYQIDLAGKQQVD